MNLQSLLEPTVAAAKDAGAFIRKERQHFDLGKVEHKGFNDLVSYVDKEAEKIIVKALSNLFPEAGFITEEQTVEQVDTPWKWIVDPLDGTTNFVHGIPSYAVSIALAKDGVVMLGVVYEVGRDECFTAYRGGGAFCNGRPIRVSEVDALSKSLIATGFPYYLGNRLEAHFDLLKDLVLTSHGLRRIGSAAVDLCYVACGRVEAYFEYNLQSYDIAAGTLVLEEAGGKVSNFQGGPVFLFAGEVVGSNGRVHGLILEKMKALASSK
ncbi:inositol monophosphatase family protein [Lunatimonas salinarum]|uniref:inositol monophosphatase family protein n=1 Tax=Lunatimonas salinarum TaxID=1774590 RepID=UPI001ADF635F|nr:inositol monophosphatase family protein [Lunatimonas salinarum]